MVDLEDKSGLRMLIYDSIELYINKGDFCRCK